jgi:Domain of unknown function (DUF4136)
MVFTIAAGIAFAVQTLPAAVKTRSEFDKTFDFRQARTWAWHPDGAGQVIASRTQKDDPEAIKALAEPIIMTGVEAEMPRRGLTRSASAPDLQLRYYLLLSVGSSAQSVGQFLPSVAQWGLPPFAPATSSLEIIERGSLVLDLSAKSGVVWRGIGEAKIEMGLEQDRRRKLLEEAVREVLKRYPPKR